MVDVETGRRSEIGYRWDAKDYSAHSSAQFTWALELVDKLGLKGSERVLDIGCGDGRVSNEIAGRLPGGSVLGIDSSREMIEHAQAEHKATRWSNLAFEIRDARNLAFRDEFDVAFSNAVLHWIKDQQKVLSGVAAGLKRGGRILFQMGGKGNARQIFVILEVMLETDRWKRFFSGFSSPYAFFGADEYSSLLVETGLTPVRVELIPRDMAQRDKEGLASWIRTTWLPYTQRLPEELRPAFIEELAHTYVQKFPPDADGLVHMEMVRLEVEAVK